MSYAAPARICRWTIPRSPDIPGYSLSPCIIMQPSAYPGRAISSRSTSPAPLSATLRLVATITPSRCPTCKAPTTPHCAGKHCPWVTCVERDCRMTHNPARPEIAPKRLDQQA